MSGGGEGSLLQGSQSPRESKLGLELEAEEEKPQKQWVAQGIGYTDKPRLPGKGCSRLEAHLFWAEPYWLYRGHWCRVGNLLTCARGLTRTRGKDKVCAELGRQVRLSTGGSVGKLAGKGQHAQGGWQAWGNRAKWSRKQAPNPGQRHGRAGPSSRSRISGTREKLGAKPGIYRGRAVQCAGD